MAYLLGNLITQDSTPYWKEDFAYQAKQLFSIENQNGPPVNYASHILNAHSITHVETELHTMANGKSIDHYFSRPNYFYGKCIVVRLPGNKYKSEAGNKNVFHWEVSKNELDNAIGELNFDKNTIEKILVTTDFYQTDISGYHRPEYVLTLSAEAADFLIDLPKFHLYGTSWKSSDYNSGLERPIHKKLFQKALIYELLNLKNVPAGEYFFVGVPLNLKGASECPVNPILLEKHEI